MRTVLGLVPADWFKVIDVSVHPTRIEIVSAMDWIGEPLSPSQLVSVLSGTKSLGHVGYHLRQLSGAEIVELVEVRPVHSSMEHFYALVSPSL